jgi:mannose-6-phosphate isomerase-like protein (cupin superfamily)
VTRSGSAIPERVNDKVELAAALATFEEPYTPRIVARMNDYKMMVVKAQGEFVWHSHPETDDAFLVLGGELVIDLRDRSVTLGAGALYVVPRGVEHRPALTAPEREL